MDMQEIVRRLKAPDFIVEHIVKAVWPRRLTMSPKIRPIFEGAKIAGPALTVKTQSGVLNTLFYQASDLVKKGDVIVIDAQGDDEYASTGAMNSYFLFKRGVEGLVIDGAVCDIVDLKRWKFPVWCRGQTPVFRGVTLDGADPGEVNVPISCGGIIVRPGDIIYADDDGVAVLPKEEAEDIVVKSESFIKFDAKEKRLIDEGWSWADMMTKGYGKDIRKFREWAEKP